MTQTRYGVRGASLLVIASMVGTGVFTTSGLLLRDIPSPLGVLAVWLGGGLVAFAGALSYAELATYAPASGGEYALLSRTFHPAIAFTAGIISLIAGFAAPIAACSIAFAHYLAAVVPGVPEIPAAAALIVTSTALHAYRAHVSQRVQDGATVLKIALIVAFLIGGGLQLAGASTGEPFVGAHDDASATREAAAGAPFSLSAFAVGLIYVYFAYTGWNAAAYVAGEVDRPTQALPRALAIGTGAVTLLYLALNAIFLAAAPRSELTGVIEIGHVAATHLFGQRAGNGLAIVIGFGLLSTVGAFVVTGARVYDAMGRDHPRLAWLARKNAHGAPIAGLWVQSGIALAMLATSSFDLLLGAIGFTLSICSALTVLGLFVERRRRGRPLGYRVPLYPLTPLAFVAVMAWTVVEAIAREPAIALTGGATVAIGLALYVLFARKE